MYSLYNVLLSEEGFYYFYTCYNVEYRCFFTQSKSGNNIIELDLESNVYSFNLIRQTEGDNTKFDMNVNATIADIFNKFFDSDPDIIINYICDDTDHKGAKRQEAFVRWIKTHNKEPMKTLIKGTVYDSIYVGAILLNTHKELDKIKDYFESELELLESETNKNGEVSVFTR